VYVRADTARGLRLPRNRSTPHILFERNGSATAITLIDTDGHVTVESVVMTGSFASRDERKIRSGMARWTFYPATLGGCAVRFRGPTTFRAEFR